MSLQDDTYGLDKVLTATEYIDEIERHARELTSNEMEIAVGLYIDDYTVHEAILELELI